MIRANVRVNGIVQGVGFRPFIHKQITFYHLNGWIRNTSAGAEIELEGEESDIDAFLRDLWTKAPKLAVIQTVQFDKYEELNHYADFRIIESKSLDSRNTLISPDVCICDDCLAELRDPYNRRHRYAFLNCTNCGPRFTIIKDVPYDRPKTTMGVFPMCPDCHEEYTTITDRRYHAQPTCCPDCGPHLLWYAGNILMEGISDDEAVAHCQKLLKEGGIVAIKGLGGMHLACTFDDPAVPARLRQRKHRDEKPFAIMCKDLETVKRFCTVSEAEEKLLTGFRRPIVLLRKKNPDSLQQISENEYVGIMLPYTPLHYLIFDEAGGLDALVMTSANLSDLPIMYRNEEALENLKNVADGFLLNNRDIHVRCDDSLLWAYDGHEYLARRSRGYVPFPVIMQHTGPMVLACGAEQKASFCLSKNNYVFPSQHIGDLKNIETYENYQQQISHFQRLFDIKPSAIVCDLHPDYLSTSYAQERAEDEDLPLLQVQHHYAHMAACMADNNVDEPCIGIIWDGTGYGTDGTVWGGEFLVGDFSGFTRRGRIDHIRLPGGDRVTKELDRTAASLLKDCGYGPEVLPAQGVERIYQMLDMNLNCPKASSMGRLFDAVSAILGIKHKASYEGQGAVLLEAAAVSGVKETYPVLIEDLAEETGQEIHVFRYKPMVDAMMADLEKGLDHGILAAKFMNTLVRMAAEMCQLIGNETGIHKVVLSGGSFQNMYILSRLMPLLKDEGFDAYCHCRVSANDEGLSLGQAAIALKRLNGE